MKVTDAHLSLVSYHIQEKEKVIPDVYRPETEKELLDILRLGTPYEPVFSLIDYKGKPPANLQVSYYNTVYLCTKEVNSWKELGKEWLEVLELHPELYKYRLDQSIYKFTYTSLFNCHKVFLLYISIGKNP